MSATAIHVEGLGKRFRIGAARQKPQGLLATFRHALASPFAYLGHSLRQAAPDEVLWALKDVSFDVPPGQVVGIIGRNGAGKTTLLKILSRITDPSAGRADIFGRVGCLLAVGTGFHPELTGRENIYLNGAIMGMRKAEIDARFEEIVDFAEVAKFIDTQVKYYSSGMFVRLGFSVAAHLEPEILIVDEVLAVGDVAFQKKCLGKMGSVAGEGRTVLLVSHNMEAILGLCQRALLIEGGRLAADGPPQEVVNAYMAESLNKAKAMGLEAGQRQGDNTIEIRGFSLRGQDGLLSEYARCGEPVELVIDYRTRTGQEMNNVGAWVWVRDQMGREITLLRTAATIKDFDRVPGEGSLICRLEKTSFVPGNYLLDLAVMAVGHRTDKVLGGAILEVVPGDYYGTGHPVNSKGIMLCEHTWRVE